MLEFKVFQNKKNEKFMFNQTVRTKNDDYRHLFRSKTRTKKDDGIVVIFSFSIKEKMTTLLPLFSSQQNKIEKIKRRKEGVYLEARVSTPGLKLQALLHLHVPKRASKLWRWR
jgi:hypothetical protein